MPRTQLGYWGVAVFPCDTACDGYQAWASHRPSDTLAEVECPVWRHYGPTPHTHGGPAAAPRHGSMKACSPLPATALPDAVNPGKCAAQSQW